MLDARVIPCLLVQNRGLVKTVGFKNPVYVGDPINAVRIFNEKEVDEIILLDITATMERRSPPLEQIAEIAGEAFMPLCYGGGIRSLDQIRKIIGAGIEKVAINSYAAARPQFIREAADSFGSQSVVLSVDVKKNSSGKNVVVTERATKKNDLELIEYVQRAEELGAGEILLNSVDRDGTMQGYDLELIRCVSTAVSIPTIALGGAGRNEHFSQAVRLGGAQAAAAGSMFVFYGKHRAVLISYPDRDDLRRLLG